MKRSTLFVSLILLLAATVIPATATPTVTSISPATAPNYGDVTVTITGTGFSSQSSVDLASPDTPTTIYGTIVSTSPTSITCTFSLNGQTPAKYHVYVNTPFTDAAGHTWPQDTGMLNLGFTIYQGTATTEQVTTAPVTTYATPVPPDGSIFVSSYPSGANIYLDNEYRGLTPLTLKNIENGRHVVRVRLTGYEEWMTTEVVYGDSTSLSARLTPVPTTTTVITTIPTTVATIRKTVSPLGAELGIIALLGIVVFLVKRK